MGRQSEGGKSRGFNTTAPLPDKQGSAPGPNPESMSMVRLPQPVISCFKILFDGSHPFFQNFKNAESLTVQGELSGKPYQIMGSLVFIQDKLAGQKPDTVIIELCCRNPKNIQNPPYRAAFSCFFGSQSHVLTCRHVIHDLLALVSCHKGKTG